MAAIKFSKQYIEPNPNEIDYWVDLSSNQYGGRMKYYNGFEWVDLVNPDGTHIDINDFYNKLQINQMLSQKASVDSVESKVDDDEVSDVIKNISFSQRGEDGVEMVMFKYDDTTVGIQLPIADNTKSGIITKDTFKNLVNQTQLQQLYSEMYTKLSEIRNNYQPKLRAGANIKIENNVISAVSKIGTDWNDIANKPDIYDKSQVDTMMSGVYKIKGSRRFEALPLYGNTVGDTYNITNDFSLHGEDYPLGTNVVWTENGWDALAGIFDTSELEEDIQEVKDNSLTVSDKLDVLSEKTFKANAVFASYNRTSTFSLVFRPIDKEDRYLTYSDGELKYGDATSLSKIWHEGNDGEGSGLDADTVDGVHSSDLFVSPNYWQSLGDFNDIDQQGFYAISGANVSNCPVTFGNLILFYNSYSPTYSNAQIVVDAEKHNLQFRHKWDKVWSKWKTIAFTDSDITGNAATATKLKTPIKLWGNDFDGSSDIPVTSIGQMQYLNFTGTDLETPIGYIGRGSNATNDIYIGTHSIDAAIRLFSGNDTENNITLLSTGRVGIGTGDPKSKLDVFGNVSINSKIAISDDTNSNYVIFGQGARDTYVRGNNIHFLASTESNKTVSISSNGNLGINVTHPLYKLHVNGDARLYYLNVENGNEINSYSDPEKTLGQAIHLNYRNTGNISLVAGGGNVGIGTTNPQHKLEVAGTITSSDLNGATFVYPWGIDSGGHVKANGHVYIPNNNGVVTFDTNNVPHRIMLMTPANEFLIGHDIVDSAYSTFIDGKNITFRYNKHNVGMTLNSSGNVTIGEADLASTASKLYVDGKVRINNSDLVMCTDRNDVFRVSNQYDRTYIQARHSNEDGSYNDNGYLNITGYNSADLSKFTVRAKDTEYTGNVKINKSVNISDQITSGDLVDWYGVSWSEDSSDPTCTRIGNMALHRSLPILSAMQGYLILRPIDFILPLTSNWEKSKYDGAHNNGAGISSYGNSNVMVKIPEFWYTDDYEPSTKTHNLKISQTAKAGWCHHKEAYVGAYEGYDDGSYYRSAKDYIPTVSVTRETLRTKARSNGYEDEYKWNIYTYEEHRAICHLFLVEYATRNSQAPVNTALTADGFKQGGLGSGCTTGTVKINGVDTYSFIPTGTTDSLGNGSGQVAYTVTLTDADGNEIGTITRYANRYRGIENPFGHIWKNVDDIVNVYNAESGNKTIYKCNKPEHFATNKNAKYKPLCSFPGGSKMQGWSKEIKATINCDFFKYSVGGSESTYWCDYNYDDDDTSEHCLLIGGGSGHGGTAGLFRFHLDDGVRNSSVHFGSRLTYLPWAE